MWREIFFQWTVPSLLTEVTLMLADDMMMSVVWYYRPEHTETEKLPQSISCEIFASKHRDETGVACIDDTCHVLTLNEYNRYAILYLFADGALLILSLFWLLYSLARCVFFTAWFDNKVLCVCMHVYVYVCGQGMGDNSSQHCLHWLHCRCAILKVNADTWMKHVVHLGTRWAFGLMKSFNSPIFGLHNYVFLLCSVTGHVPPIIFVTIIP